MFTQTWLFCNDTARQLCPVTENDFLEFDRALHLFSFRGWHYFDFVYEF